MAFENGKCACLIIFGKVDQRLFPWKDIVSIPYVVVCTLEAVCSASTRVVVLK